MKISLPPQVAGQPQTDDEIAWRRELKQLRVRVVQLEAERGFTQRPSIDGKRLEAHGYQCGRPCGVTVSENTPRVECSACGTKLDPVEVLRDYAHHERNFCYSLEHLRKERAELLAGNAKLKALRLRLRGQARKLLPEPPPGGRNKYERDIIANMQLDRVLAEEKP